MPDAEGNSLIQPIAVTTITDILIHDKRCPGETRTIQTTFEEDGKDVTVESTVFDTTKEVSDAISKEFSAIDRAKLAEEVEKASTLYTEKDGRFRIVTEGEPKVIYNGQADSRDLSEAYWKEAMVQAVNERIRARMEKWAEVTYGDR